jgi:hypothetical protein
MGSDIGQMKRQGRSWERRIEAGSENFMRLRCRDGAWRGTWDSIEGKGALEPNKKG